MSEETRKTREVVRCESGVKLMEAMLELTKYGSNDCVRPEIKRIVYLKDKNEYVVADRYRVLRISADALIGVSAPDGDSVVTYFPKTREVQFGEPDARPINTVRQWRNLAPNGEKTEIWIPENRGEQLSKHPGMFVLQHAVALTRGFTFNPKYFTWIDAVHKLEPESLTMTVASAETMDLEKKTGNHHCSSRILVSAESWDYIVQGLDYNPTLGEHKEEN